MRVFKKKFTLITKSEVHWQLTWFLIGDNIHFLRVDYLLACYSHSLISKQPVSLSLTSKLPSPSVFSLYTEAKSSKNSFKNYSS